MKRGAQPTLDSLMEATNNGDLEGIQDLLTNFGNEISGKDKGSALKNAAIKGHVNIVKYLLDNVGIEISSRDKESALLSAAIFRRLNIIQQLLSLPKAEMSAEAKTKALCYAIENGDSNMVQHLVAVAGDQIIAKCITEAMINKALARKYYSILQQLLPIVVTQIPFELKGNLLQGAARDGNVQTVQQLLTLVGNQPSSTFQLHKEWALDVAIGNGHIEIAYCLLLKCPELRNSVKTKELQEIFQIEEALVLSLADVRKEKKLKIEPEFLSKIVHYIPAFQTYPMELRKGHENHTAQMYYSLIKRKAI